MSTYKVLDADLDDGENLAKFFGLMRRFNANVEVEYSLKTTIEAFFDYKWQFDRNQAIDDEEELAMLEQLPEEVQNKIYTNFLFKEFLKTFSQTFTIYKDEFEEMKDDDEKFCRRFQKQFTWQDE